MYICILCLHTLQYNCFTVVEIAEACITLSEIIISLLVGHTQCVTSTSSASIYVRLYERLCVLEHPISEGNTDQRQESNKTVAIEISQQDTLLQNFISNL